MLCQFQAVTSTGATYGNALSDTTLSSNTYLNALHKQIKLYISNSDSWSCNMKIMDNVGFEDTFGNALVVVDPNAKEGTWFYEDVAIAYAYKCNVDFRLWVINHAVATQR